MLARMALRSAFADVMAALPRDLEGAIKPELLQCYLEINTGVCKDVDEVRRDLQGKIDAVRHAAARHDLRLFWGGTHPFSRWQDQEVTPNERYLEPHRPAPGNGPAARHLRPARPRGGRLGRQGHHDLRPDHAAPADSSWPSRPTVRSGRAATPACIRSALKVMETLPTAGLPP